MFLNIFFSSDWSYHRHTLSIYYIQQNRCLSSNTDAAAQEVIFP